MEDVTVLVEAEINPTETEEKVKTAVANIFGDMLVNVKPLHVGSVLVAESKSRGAVENFGALLRRDRVRAAARKILYRAVRDNTICFFLNKQAAFAGHVSFSQETGESPLGPLKVTIETENPRELIDRLAPKIE